MEDKNKVDINKEYTAINVLTIIIITSTEIKRIVSERRNMICSFHGDFVQ
jgi:hypothetical protein